MPLGIDFLVPITEEKQIRTMMVSENLQTFGGISVLDFASLLDRYIISNSDGLKRMGFFTKTLHPSEFSGGVWMMCDLKCGLMTWIIVIECFL